MGVQKCVTEIDDDDENDEGENAQPTTTEHFFRLMKTETLQKHFFRTKILMEFQS